jgi:hypothetical protein
LPTDILLCIGTPSPNTAAGGCPFLNHSRSYYAVATAAARVSSAVKSEGEAQGVAEALGLLGVELAHPALQP